MIQSFVAMAGPMIFLLPVGVLALSVLAMSKDIGRAIVERH